jgi:hypothetical protein
MTRGPRTSATAATARAGGLHWAERDAGLRPVDGVSGLRAGKIRGRRWTWPAGLHRRSWARSSWWRAAAERRDEVRDEEMRGS